MILKIKSIINIRYEQSKIQEICSTFQLTYIGHSRSDYEINLEIVEDLPPKAIESIRKALVQQTIAELITIEV